MNTDLIVHCLFFCSSKRILTPDQFQKIETRPLPQLFPMWWIFQICTHHCRMWSHMYKYFSHNFKTKISYFKNKFAKSAFSIICKIRDHAIINAHYAAIQLKTITENPLKKTLINRTWWTLCTLIMQLRRWIL